MDRHYDMNMMTDSYPIYAFIFAAILVLCLVGLFFECTRPRRRTTVTAPVQHIPIPIPVTVYQQYPPPYPPPQGSAPYLTADISGQPETIVVRAIPIEIHGQRI